MSAPSKATGGKGKPVQTASGRKTRGAARPETTRRSLFAETGNNLHLDDQSGRRKVQGSATQSGSPTLTTSKLPKPPQGHGGYETKIKRKLPRREGTPPRYTNQSVKGDMLEAAIAAASERGYEAMRISEVTDPVGVTRQAFYAHFRDKRHCMAEAIDPKLGAIERMAASLSESDPDAATKLAHALDDLIAERFGSAEGTRGRLIQAMIELLRKEGAFHKVRIGALVKAAHVPPGDFYRQFSGKGECFAVAYEQLLGDLVTEIRECPAEHSRHDVPALLRSLAEALGSDHQRRRILVIEAAHLPDQPPAGVEGARKDALWGAIAELLATAADVSSDEPRLSFAAASVVEVIRSSEVAGEGVSLPDRLAELSEAELLLASPGRANLHAAA